MTLDEARAQGLTRYYSGKPCKNGHLSERYVNGGGGCVQCMREGEDRRRRAEGKPPLAEYRASLAARKVKASPHRKRSPNEAWLHPTPQRNIVDPASGKYIGKPCKHGHDGERYIIGNGCVECARIATQRQQARKASLTSIAKVPPQDPSAPPPDGAWWNDDGGIRRVTTVNPLSKLASTAGWTNCLGRLAVHDPHRFFSKDVKRLRVCLACRRDE